MREHIVLACTVCKSRNYHTTKNKQKTKNKLELKKFCPKCGKHTIHREVK